MCLQMALFRSFLQLRNSPLYICTTSFFIHLSVNGYSGCFHVLAIINTAAMNIGVRVSFPVMAFSSLHKLLGTLVKRILAQGFPGGSVVRIRFPVQGTQVRSLAQEDPTCHRATRPVTTTIEPVLWSPGTTATELTATTEASAPTEPASTREVTETRSPHIEKPTDHSQRRGLTAMNSQNTQNT